MATVYGVNIDRSGHEPHGILVATARVSPLTTGEKDTGIDFLAGDVILDVFVDVKTAEATASTKNIDVGLLSSESGGDTDGFIDGVSTATAATARPLVTVTTGSNTKFFASNTFGVLLSDFEAGTDVAGDEGLFSKKTHHITTAKSLVYQLGSAHTELVADIYVVFFRPQV